MGGIQLEIGGVQQQMDGMKQQMGGLQQQMDARFNDATKQMGGMQLKMDVGFKDVRSDVGVVQDTTSGLVEYSARKEVSEGGAGRITPAVVCTVAAQQAAVHPAPRCHDAFFARDSGGLVLCFRTAAVGRAQHAPPHQRSARVRLVVWRRAQLLLRRGGGGGSRGIHGGGAIAWVCDGINIVIVASAVAARCRAQCSVSAPAVSKLSALITVSAAVRHSSS
jgi:hypothetical protein